MARTAYDIVRDLRGHGRTDQQINTVAAASHGGRFKDEVEELLKLSPEEFEHVPGKHGSPRASNRFEAAALEHAEEVLTPLEPEPEEDELPVLDVPQRPRKRSSL